MSITKAQFIQYYARQAKNEDTSLFLGSGISASAGYLSWKTLLQPCADELGIELDDSMDLFLLAQYYANKFGYNALKRIINENVNLHMHESTLIDELLNLNFTSIWTTNYDTVLEKNFTKRNILTNSIYYDRDLANVSRNNRVSIYKLNGDISNLDRIVITQQDLDVYNHNHELLLTFFKRELVVNTFLFLGYSFTDTIALSCLSSVNRCLQDSTNSHFAIMKSNDSKDFEHFVEDMEHRYHVQVLIIDDYESLPKVLNELNEKITEKNIFFSGVFDQLPSDEDELAKNICRALAGLLIDRGFKLYTGYGRSFGNYLCGWAIQHLLSRNKKIDRHLVMRPFLSSMSNEDKSIHREMLISDCNVALFMFGQTPLNGSYVESIGMIQEFEITKKLGKFIIPVGCTGYTARKIWEEVKGDITRYPYLERYIDELNKPDHERIPQIILQILTEICCAR